MVHSYSQPYCVEILKQLHETVRKKRSELLPNDLIPHNDNALAHKEFMAQKSIKIKHPPYSPALAPNIFWLFQKIKSALKGRKFQDAESKNVTTVLKSCSTEEVPNVFQTVAASLG